jgi:hypothetical protein
METEAGRKNSQLSPLPTGVRGSADFSGDMKYRYWLERRWQTSLPQFTFILLNPSKADAVWDDRTTQKLHLITSAHLGGGFELVNLFATVDTAQLGLHLRQAVEHEPGANDLRVLAAIERSERLVIGWGDGNGDSPHAAERRAAIRRRAASIWPVIRSRELWCVKRNEVTGSPRHPGRGIPNDIRLVRYVPTGRYP